MTERERTPDERDDDSDIEELEGMEMDDEELGATERPEGMDEPSEDAQRRKRRND